MSFASDLQSARLDRHLTAEEAAAVFDHLSPRTFTGWEQGRLEAKVHLHAPLLEYFERHAPRRAAPKGPQPGRPPKMRRKAGTEASRHQGKKP